MVALLKGILDTAMATEGGKLEVRGDESSKLRLYKLSTAEMGHWNALSDGLRRQWAQE